MWMFISLCVLCVLALSVLFSFFPKPPKQTHRHYDAALVLGCPCQKDGTLSRLQKRRMDHALALHEAGAYTLLCVSGGSVKNEYGEAMHMLAYALQQRDIPHIVETKARNTYENFVYASALLKERGVHSLIVITSPFHARRANYFAKRYFSDYCVSTYRAHDRLRNYPIECYCMCKCLWIEWKLHRAAKRAHR